MRRREGDPLGGIEVRGGEGGGGVFKRMGCRGVSEGGCTCVGIRTDMNNSHVCVHDLL